MYLSKDVLDYNISFVICFCIFIVVLFYNMLNEDGKFKTVNKKCFPELTYHEYKRDLL